MVDGLISGGTSIQLIAATHSPLVLVSVEPCFDETKDRLFHLDIQDGQVCLDVVPWARQGDLVNRLVSDVFGLRQGRSHKLRYRYRIGLHVFGLRQGRSLGAEQIIAEAQALMVRGGSISPEDRDRVHQELERALPEHAPFWPRWVVRVERQADQA